MSHGGGGKWDIQPVADTGQVSQVCLTMFEIDLKKISFPSKRKFKIKLGDLRYLHFLMK
jgi:hypothetical protein